MDDGMDKDLAQKLNDLLNSPDSMQKIQAGHVRLGDGRFRRGACPVGGGRGRGKRRGGRPGYGGPVQSARVADRSPVPAGSGSHGREKKPRVVPPKQEGGGMDLSVIAKLAPMMASMNRDDQDTVLLKALRPYLHGDREKRLDDAIKILRFIKIMPLLREKGLF